MNVWMRKSYFLSELFDFQAIFKREEKNSRNFIHQTLRKKHNGISLYNVKYFRSCAQKKKKHLAESCATLSLLIASDSVALKNCITVHDSISSSQINQYLCYRLSLMDFYHTRIYINLSFDTATLLSKFHVLFCLNIRWLTKQRKPF